MLRPLLLTGCMVGVLSLAGCGENYSAVSGTVTLEGVPVEGATVNFVADDGGKTFSGFTDASGKFELKSGTKPGATPGKYKVTVTKVKAVSGADNMKPGEGDYLKQMKAMQKKGAKETQSELPSQYSSADKTPLTVSVPVSEPVKLELKK